MIKWDLTNCYPSLKLSSKARGSFRVQGTNGVSDLRSLPFGWRFSPPICQETVAGILGEVLRRMPLPAGYLSWDEVEFDHYLDDLLFVEEDKEWLMVCGPLLADYLRIEGFVISQKSVLEPVKVTKWLGKLVDLHELSIDNSQVLQTRLFAALLQLYGKVVHVKLAQRVLGLIGWCSAPGRGHLPFLAGICNLLAFGRSDYVRATYNMWRSLVTATFFAIPTFRIPRVLSPSWMFVKWLSMDTAEYVSSWGMRYRVGLFDGKSGQVFECPNWVVNQQVAKTFGVWNLIRMEARKKFGRVCMLQDNIQAVWNTINLRSRAGLWHQNRVLRAVAHQLRRSGIVVHVVQPADPLSREPEITAKQVRKASVHAKLRWNYIQENVDRLQFKGLAFVPV